MGEGIEKKSVDFAAEVAAQTAAKADAKPAAEAPKVEEVKEEEEAPKVGLVVKIVLVELVGCWFLRKQSEVSVVFVCRMCMSDSVDPRCSVELAVGQGGQCLAKVGDGFVR